MMERILEQFSNLDSSLKRRAVAAFSLIPFVLGLIAFGGWVFALFLFAIMMIALLEWGIMAYKTNNFPLYLITGFLYLFLCFDCLYTMRMNYPVAIAFIFLFMLWSSDTGAYIFGKTFGKSKMCPSISPNKTWAGFRGAIIAPALLGLLVSFVYPYFNGVGYNALFFIVLGGVSGAAGQGGDLLVSYVKRRAQIKDTGNLIPGHGGILDRIDSVLLCAPVFLMIITEARSLLS